MVATLIGLLITLAIWAFILYIVWIIINLIPAPPPFKPLIQIVFWLIVLLVMVQILLGGTYLPRYPMRFS